MKVILFRSRLRPDVDVEAYQRHADALYALARQIPGFVSSEDFSAENGDRLAVIAFEDDDALREWREHPEHRAAQARGRSEYFESYGLQICELERGSAFP